MTPPLLAAVLPISARPVKEARRGRSKGKRPDRRADRQAGRCPGCGLRPQDKGHVVVDDKDPAPELSEVCPACGRNTKIHIRVVYEAERGGA